MALHVTARDHVISIDADGSVSTHLEGLQPEAVAAHPDAPERLFCGTFTDGLYRSTDNGDSWEQVGADVIDPGEDPDQTERRGADGGVSVMSVAIDPSDPDRIWAGTEPSGLFCSPDGGDSWTDIANLTDQPSADDWAFPPRPYTHHTRTLAIDPADGDRLYVGIEAGALLLTTDGGETWTDRPPGSRRDNHTLASHPDAPDRVYSAAGDGFAISADKGESWDHPQVGLDHTYVWGLAVDAGDPDTVVVSSAHGAGNAHGHGNADSYVYRRTGDGAWSTVADVPQGDGVLRAVLTSSAPGQFVAANNRGVFESTDGGASWSELDVAWEEHGGDQGPRSIVDCRPWLA